MIECLQLLGAIMGISLCVFIVFYISIISDVIRAKIPSVSKTIPLSLKIRIFKVSLLVLLVSSGVAFYIVHINHVTESDLRMGYERIVNINQLRNVRLKHTYQVAAFSPQAYEIGKPNFGTEGYCYGIVKTERESFYKGKPNKFSAPVIGDNTDKHLYPRYNPYFYLDYLKHEGSLENNNWQDFTAKRLDGIPVYKLPDKELIKAIIGAQKRQNFKGSAIFNQPPTQSILDKLLYVIVNAIDKKCIIENNIDTDWIVSQIKLNKPVIFGVGNMYSGHALLCYKVDIYDNNAYKFYVLDPNVVYSTPTASFEECTFLLIWEEEGKQVYNYNPQINKNYIYRGQYNSYSQGAYFNWG